MQITLVTFLAWVLKKCRTNGFHIVIDETGREKDNILVVDEPEAFTNVAIGEASSQGIEVDISGELSEGLDLWASYTYVDVQAGNSFFDANFGFTVEAGSVLLNIPEHQLNVQLVKSSEV
jgi:iron complex outermembrane receptor protein